MFALHSSFLWFYTSLSQTGHIPTGKEPLTWWGFEFHDREETAWKCGPAPPLHGVSASFPTSPVHLQVHRSEVGSQRELTSSPRRASLQPGELSSYLHNLWPFSGLPLPLVYLCVSGGSGFKFNATKCSLANFSQLWELKVSCCHKAFSSRSIRRKPAVFYTYTYF